jgi:membrane-associated protein
LELIKTLIDFILHIDQHLVEIVSNYKTWTYLILFLIIFAETGLVVTPFLPGDSLLFAAGAIIAKPDSNMNIVVTCILLIVAAILGDLVNYHVGNFIGHKAFSGRYRFLKKEYLERTQEFYYKHGGKTIIYALVFKLFVAVFFLWRAAYSERKFYLRYFRNHSRFRVTSGH